MILTCPECKTRYNIGTAKLGPSGRKVRCKKCSHVWVEKPTLQPVDPPSPTPEPAQDPLVSAAASTATPPKADPIRATKRPTVKRNLPAVTDQTVAGSTLKAWAMFFAGFVALLAILIIARGAIISLWEPAKHVYALVGMSSEPPQPELTLDEYNKLLNIKDLKPSVIGQNEGLKIEGTIYNLSEQAMVIPTLRASAIDKQGRELSSWYFEVPNKALLPGEHQAFSTSFPQLRDGVDSVSVIYWLDAVPSGRYYDDNGQGN